MLKRNILLILLVLILPAIIFLTAKNNVHLLQSLRSTSFAVPKLKEQPKDTEILASPIPVHHWLTSQGTPVYFVPTESGAMIDILISFDAGSSRDTEKWGLAYLTAKSLSKGTSQHTVEQIAQIFESHGAIYKSTIDRDRMVLSLRSLTDPNMLQPALKIFSEIIAQPAFFGPNFQQLKNQTLLSLKKDEQQPNKIAQKKFYETIYGQHPYAHPIQGAANTVAQISVDDLKQFHQRYLVANNATLTIVGGIHRDLARTISENILALLSNGEKAKPLPKVSALTENKEMKIPFHSNQSHVVLGQPVRIVGDPDYFPLMVGNYILGGGSLVSRLFQEIREKKGLVYSVSSVMSGLKDPGPFYINLQTKTTQTDETITLIKQILNEFVDKGPTDTEVQAAHKGMVGSFPLNFNSNEKIAELIAELSFYHVPMEFLKNYPKDIEKVTVDSIKKVFKARVHPHNMGLIVVGPNAKP